MVVEALTSAAHISSLEQKIDYLLSALQTEGEEIRMDLTQLQTAVEKVTSVNQSAITLIQSIATQLGSIAGDQKAVQDYAASLSRSAQDLADAVTANTPSA